MLGSMGRARIALAVMAAWLAWSAAPALASTFVVSNNDGSGLGSLAQAMTDANNDHFPPELITFAPGVTGIINLTAGALPTPTQDTTINGPGAGVLDIDGNGHQVLSVASGTTVSISGLEVSGGVSSPHGGAIMNDGTLTISDSVFSHNASGGSASGAHAGDGDGGAIANSGSGTLTVTGSLFSDNSAGGNGGAGAVSAVGFGGAISNQGTLTVTGSTFTHNTAGGNGGDGSVSGMGAGGAIDNVNGAATITNSTFTANHAGGAAGTGSGSGVGHGGALRNTVALFLTGDTFDANSVGPATSAGAGIETVAASNVTVVDTIVSGNLGAPNCTIHGAGLSASGSLEGPAGQASCGFDLPSADPLLGPLGDNGGPVPTQALAAGSPAIGAVTPVGDCPATDQRGSLRPRGGCDSGAYEVAPPVIANASAASVTTTSANLAAAVSNPDVLAGAVSFQYGTSTAYGSTTASQALPASAPSSQYGASLAGLVPGTTYHFRVVAQNPDGSVVGPDQQFTTASPVSTSSTPSKPPPPSNAFTFGKAKVGPGGRITLAVNTPGPGRFAATATFTVRTRRGNKRLTTKVTYGIATVNSTAPGKVTLLIGVRPATARQLRLLGGRQVRITVTFTPVGGTAHSETTKLAVKRSRKGKFS